MLQLCDEIVKSFSGFGIIRWNLKDLVLFNELTY
jgi:hypothetical protein